MRDFEDSYYINRTFCDVVSDMRLCNKTQNYGPMESLIEELQIKGNRMEAAIYDKNDIAAMNKEWAELKKKLKKIRKKVKAKK